MKQLYQFFVIFIVAIYCSYAYLYFYNAEMTSLKPLYWHLLAMSFAVAVLSTRIYYGYPLIDGSVAVWIWLWLFLLNSVACYLYSPQGEIEEEALYESFRVTALLASFLIIFQVEGAIRLSQITIIFIIFIALVINFIDFITPAWSTVPGRAAGLYENPTISGKILVMLMVVSIPAIPKNMRWIYCGLVGLGVLVTFSRGPWLLWGIALAGLAMTGYLRFGRKITSISFVSFISVFIIYNLLTGGLLEFFAFTGLNEYLTTGTIGRLGGSGPAFSDYSAVSRAVAAERAWDVFGDNPWFGAGLAFDQSWTVGAHNTYLRMAGEGGLFRLALFIGLLTILWNITDRIGKVALLVYALSSMTSHDNLRQPALLLLIGLIATLNIYHTTASRGNEREVESIRV